jgi:hypothetical protein
MGVLRAQTRRRSNEGVPQRRGEVGDVPHPCWQGRQRQCDC